MNYWITCFLLCYVGGSLSAQELPKGHGRRGEKMLLDELFRRGSYDRRIRPSAANGTDEPTRIETSVLFQGFPTISDQKMEITTILTLRQQWLDTRLGYQHLNGQKKYLTLTDVAKIWTPDVYFPDQRGVNNPMGSHSFVRIFPDGRVLYSTRLSLTLSCPMDLRMFLMDRQTCSVDFGSYAYTKEDVEFTWKQQAGVESIENLKMPRFHLADLDGSSYHLTTSSGQYSYLRVTLRFRRDFAYYMIQLYIPCCLIIVVSWFSFWLDATASPARTTLGVTTFLATATQTSNISNALPPVSYTKAIDVWTAVCLTFVICALLEYALVNKFARYERNRENRPKLRQEQSTTWCTWLAKYPTRSKRLDMASRMIFPLMFTLFNVIYWTAYSPTA